MDTSKLDQAIAEAEADAARSLRLVADLKAARERATNGASENRPSLRRRLTAESIAEPKSTLKTAIAVLREQPQPMHINELGPMVSKLRGKLTPRASLESVLVTAIKAKKFGLKRTAPGTYE